MERETLVTLLLLVLGGVAMQSLAPWRLRAPGAGTPQDAERRAWWLLWLPVAPVVIIAAWLCGWASQQPDPVRAHLNDWVLFLGGLPFALITLRALFRAAWALLGASANSPVCTVGLLRPCVVFSPFLARHLNERQVRATWEHESAHARHRDPLRLWCAQIATDLQWPWPGARRRFDAWLEALEWARDDEARACGACGADLAAALLATARYQRRGAMPRQVRHAVDLLGSEQALRQRIARLLSPLPEPVALPRRRAPLQRALIAAAPFAMLAGGAALGALYGNPMLNALFAWTLGM